MSDIKKHDDFGEKIGGAKKDLWKTRGLLSSDLGDMNSREADKYIKKDNIWKKADYQELIDSGIPVDVAYFCKKVRDSLPASPVYLPDDNTPEKKQMRQIQYIDTIREVQSVIENVKTKDDAKAAFSKVFIDNGYYAEDKTSISIWPSGQNTGYSRGYDKSYSWTEKAHDNPLIRNKFIKVLNISSEWHFNSEFTQKAKKLGFGLPKGEKSLDKSKIQNGKQRFIPKQLENIQRNGPDYRNGKDIDGQDYIDVFGFRGGEFGNWMNQNDRQASLNFGYDALKDLAFALQISDKDISYQGELSIAFGSRGDGGGSAVVAHYELLLKVINLTKMKGAGSLAHEWWHGLDDFLGSKMGIDGLLSSKPSKYPLFDKLIETIKYKPETLEQAQLRTDKSMANHKKNAESWLTSIVSQPINRLGDEKITAEYEAFKNAFLNGEIGSVEKLNQFKKSVTGRVIPKDKREILLTFVHILHSYAESKEPIIGKVKTDYHINSLKIGTIYRKDGGYWESNEEMTARAFATYIMEKLPWKSDYLAGHAECATAIIFDNEGNATKIKAFPQGEERKAINAVFDEIIADLKLQKIFSHEEKAQEFTVTAMEEAKTVKENVQKNNESTKESVIDKINTAKATDSKTVLTDKSQNKEKQNSRKER